MRIDSVAGRGTPPRRRSVRRRFTTLYAGLFLASGAAMLVVVGLFTGASVESAPGPGVGPVQDASAAAQARIAALEDQLAQAQDRHTQAILLGSAVGLVVMGLLSLLLGWFAAGRVLRPVRAMTAATRRISADNLHERLAVGGPHDELRDLGDTIDELLARLEGSFAAQRRFVADASHELRTPLATMRAAVDVTLAKPGPLPAQTQVLAGRVRTELDQVERLLDGLLTLARAQHELPEPEAVALDALAAAALAARGLPGPQLSAGAVRDAGERGGDGDGSGDGGGGDGLGRAPAGGLVRGNRVLLRRLVENLIDNAVVHNAPDGWVRVEVRAVAGPAVELTVENGGPVLASAQVAEFVRPFRRAGPDRRAAGSGVVTGTGSGTGPGMGSGSAGSGLGLAIVAAVTEAHSGRLDLRARAEGGLRVVVTLPGVPDGPPGGPTDQGTRSDG